MFLVSQSIGKWHRSRTRDHCLLLNTPPSESGFFPNQIDATWPDCMVPIDGITDEGGLQILNYAPATYVDLPLTSHVFPECGDLCNLCLRAECAHVTRSSIHSTHFVSYPRSLPAPLYVDFWFDQHVFHVFVSFIEHNRGSMWPDGYFMVNTFCKVSWLK